MIEMTQNFFEECEKHYKAGEEAGINKAIDIIESFVKDWNMQSNKRIPYKAKDELIEYIRQQSQKEQNNE